MGRACSRHGREDECIWGSGFLPEGKIPLGRPRRRWEYNNKMNYREIGWSGMDWIDLVKDRDQ
jgi:hypothetical protein